MVLIRMLLPVAKMFFSNNFKNIGDDLIKEINEFLLSLYFVNLVSVVAITFCCLSVLSLLTISLILLSGVAVDFQLILLLAIMNVVILVASAAIIARSISKIKVKSASQKNSEIEKIFDEVERVMDKYLDSFDKEEKRVDLNERLKNIEEQLLKISGPINGPGLQQNVY